MPVIRCSKAPSHMACPASAWMPQPFQITGPEAMLGTAVHKAGARHIGGAEAEPLYDDKWGLKPEQMDDFRYLLSRLMAAWKELSPTLTGVQVEQRREHTLSVTDRLTLAGTADVLALDADGTPIVLDWKSGYPDASDYTAQLRAYCWLALKEWPEAPKAKAVLVWLRSSEMVVREWTREELTDWANLFIETLTERKAEFCPGDHCRFCGGRDDCKARITTITTAVKDLLAGEVDTGAPLSPTVLAAGWDKVKAIMGACAKYEAALKMAVRMCPKGLPLPNGRLLIMEKRQKDELHLNHAAMKAIEAQGIDPLKQLADHIKISKTSLMDLVRKKAARGQKQKVADALLEELKAADAVKTNTYEAMVTKGETTDGKN